MNTHQHFARWRMYEVIIHYFPCHSFSFIHQFNLRPSCANSVLSLYFSSVRDQSIYWFILQPCQCIRLYSVDCKVTGVWYVEKNGRKWSWRGKVIFAEGKKRTLEKRRIFGFPKDIRTKRILNTNLVHWCYSKQLAEG